MITLETLLVRNIINNNSKLIEVNTTINSIISVQSDIIAHNCDSCELLLKFINIVNSIGVNIKIHRVKLVRKKKKSASALILHSCLQRSF